MLKKHAHALIQGNILAEKYNSTGAKRVKRGPIVFVPRKGTEAIATVLLGPRQ